MSETWTIKRLMKWTTGYFREQGIDTPRLDAELLVSDRLGLDRVRLYMEYERPLNAEERGAIRDAVRRRASGEPMAYILGSWGFRDLDLAVDPRVLIPRPETELLVEQALAAVEGIVGPRIVDVGTGSGCVALALAQALAAEAPEVWAVDVSVDALDLARQNAAANGIEGVRFEQGDLLTPARGGAPFDAVVSNPPYISTGALAGLQASVIDHEPRLALDGGADGLDIVRRLVGESAEVLRDGGWLGFEIGYDQGAAARSLIAQHGGFGGIEVHADIEGRDRVVTARRRSGTDAI